MAGTIVQWAAFFLFFLLFAGVIFAEVQYLVRKGWAATGRATGFVITTDVLGFLLGGGLVGIAFLVMFMLVMGPAGRGSNTPEAAYWAITAVAIIIPPILLFILKRLFLLIFKIGSGSAAWLFSLVSALLTIIIVLVPPPLLLYFVVTLWKL